MFAGLAHLRVHSALRAGDAMKLLGAWVLHVTRQKHVRQIIAVETDLVLGIVDRAVQSLFDLLELAKETVGDVACESTVLLCTLACIQHGFPAFPRLEESEFAYYAHTRVCNMMVRVCYCRGMMSVHACTNDYMLTIFAYARTKIRIT